MSTTVDGVWASAARRCARSSRGDAARAELAATVATKSKGLAGVPRTALIQSITAGLRTGRSHEPSFVGFRHGACP